MNKCTNKSEENKSSIRISVSKQRENCVWMVVPWEFDKQKKLWNDVVI